MKTKLIPESVIYVKINNTTIFSENFISKLLNGMKNIKAFLNSYSR